MISGAQIRAARALLDLSAAELADEANVGLATILRFENQEQIPNSKAGTLVKLKATLETRGIAFLGDPERSPGVQLIRRPSAKKRRAGRPPAD